MSKKRPFIFMLITIVTFPFLFSCKKDNAPPAIVPSTYDTIVPLSYFPVYPGSYWKYVNSNNDTTLIETDPEYQLDHYTFQMDGFYSDTFYVPIYNGTPIWGYEEHTGPISNSGSYPLPMILSETIPVGQSWIIKNWGAINYSRKISVKDTTIIIAGNSYYPTIVVNEFWHSGGPPNAPFIKKSYYTKNIGLTREDTYFFTDSSVLIKEIIDYHINY
jgi:hypothetical protein